MTNAFSAPFRNFVSTARTCYSGSGIVDLQELSARDREIATSIYSAGHHTTLQHGHFQFAISNVSRQFLWNFLHSHPYYNSEQVSQRYVAVREGNYAIPPLEHPALDLYRETVATQQRCYEKLAGMLQKEVAREYLKRFPGRKADMPAASRDIKKKAQEVARYVLPVATFAYLYHTVSSLTLLRYWRLCNQMDSCLETRIVVGKMIDQLLALDPEFQTILEAPIPLEETPEWRCYDAFKCERERGNVFRAEFDRQLEGHVSRLVDWKARGQESLAASVREVLGLPAASMSDEEAVRLVLDPGRNTLLSQSLNLTTLSKLSRSLVHAHYTFQRKISHTADSQDQRHRMTPASRPMLSMHFSHDPDYITPELIRKDPEAEREYDSIMEYTWERINLLLRAGCPTEFALYLLPNAVALRFTESGNLMDLRHKYAMRLCYNAQEEIWRACLDEVQQIRQIHPLIGEYLLPPCSLRHLAGVRPVCPEGERYCGVKVWKLTPSQYQRVI